MTRDLQSEFLTLHEFVAAARARLDDNGWDYIVGAAETETTAARNRLALDRIALRPRVLVDVREVDVTGSLLGRKARLPVLLAPVGGLETFDPEGAVAAATAAGDFGVPVMVSSVTKRKKAEIRAATGHQAFFQLYVRGPGRFIEDHVEEAIEAGFEGFCLTVDTAHYSRRERDIVKRFQKPWQQGGALDAYKYQKGLNWKDVARIKKTYEIPLMLKGIATAEDARIAADHGVEVVYVSNHGGRQLDHGRGAMEVLPEVTDAIGGKAVIVIDGGFCRGTDIVKAIALGADAVGLGRLYCYGLAAAGPPGAVRLLEILENEVQTALGLLGVPRLGELGPEHVHIGAHSVTEPSTLSAFPLLDGQGSV